MADDEEVYILSSEEFNESLVLLDLQQPRTPQEQSKQYGELKNSFLALLKAYEELRKKLASAREEIDTLKKKRARGSPTSGSKPSTPMQASAVSLTPSMESADLAKIIMMYNERVVGMLNQVESQTPIVQRATNSADGNTDVSVQARSSTVDAHTQCEAAVRKTVDQIAQTGESLYPPVTAVASSSPLPNDYSLTSSMVIADVSDVEEELENEASNRPPSDTIKPPPVDAKLSDTQLSRLLFVDSSREKNPSTSDSDYKCPVCGAMFEPNTGEAQVVVHLMQCTSEKTKEASRRDCPICNKKFELNNDFNQQDFEVHVQCCCDAGDLGAVVL